MSDDDEDQGPDVMGEPWPRPLLAGKNYRGRTIVTITQDSESGLVVVEYKDRQGTHYCTRREFMRWLSENGG